ncbi:BNR-4 repeat-containing protein [Leifsonia sp. EB34]|uniref:BNR-4 repeat-containing protein n=1 Tax=Leifsonia sp. EB34 TaxID=3156303 RepID=UPI0035148499
MIAALVAATLALGAESIPAVALTKEEPARSPEIAQLRGADDFNRGDGALGSKWGNALGSWAISNARAVMNTSAGDRNILFQQRLGANFDVSARVRLTGPDSGLWNGLVFNATAGQTDRYIFRVRPAAQGRTAAWQLLHQSAARGLEVLANVGVGDAFALDTDYTVSVRSEGLNAVSVSVKDASGTERIPGSRRVELDPMKREMTDVGGLAGLYSNYGGAEFDDFALTTSDDRPAVHAERFEATGPGLISSWGRGAGSSGTWGIEDGRARLLDRGTGAATWNYILPQTHVNLGGSFEGSVDVVVDPEQPVAANSPEDTPEGGSTGIVVNLGQSGHYVFRLIGAGKGGQWQLVKNVGSEVLVSNAARGPVDLSQAGRYRLTVASSAPGKFELTVAPPSGAVIRSSVSDETGTPILTGGNAGLFTARGNKAFDNFVISSSDSAGTDRVTAVSCVGQTSAESSAALSVLTRGDRQYVAFYDGEGRLRVSQRTLSSSVGGNDCDTAGAVWSATKVLDEFHSSWNAHRSVTMAMDKFGRLHIVGALHASSLFGDPSGEAPADGHAPGAYYRSDSSGDVASLARQTEIVSPEQDGELTYPVFYTLGDGRLVLGVSNRFGGVASQGFNLWDESQERWTRIATFNNAKSGDLFTFVYFGNVVRDAKGTFHLAWVWRTGSSFNNAMNGTHNGRVSYASTTDFSTWRNAAGVTIKLPIDWADTGTIVDDVPSGTGLMPPNLALDSDGSPLLTYVHDDAKVARIYAASVNGKHWAVHRLTSTGDVGLDADKPGTFSINVLAGPLQRHSERRYTVDYLYNGSRGRLHIDTDTWETVGDAPINVKPVMPSNSIPPDGMWTQLQPDLSGQPYSLVWNAYLSEGDVELGPVLPQPIYVYTTTN